MISEFGHKVFVLEFGRSFVAFQIGVVKIAGCGAPCVVTLTMEVWWPLLGMWVSSGIVNIVSVS